jgi:hypothetical protein
MRRIVGENFLRKQTEGFRRYRDLMREQMDRSPELFRDRVAYPAIELPVFLAGEPPPVGGLVWTQPGSDGIDVFHGADLIGQADASAASEMANDGRATGKIQSVDGDLAMIAFDSRREDESK